VKRALMPVLVTSAAAAFLLLSSAECAAYPWKCTATPQYVEGSGGSGPSQTAIASSQTRASNEAVAACTRSLPRAPPPNLGQLQGGPEVCAVKCKDMRERTKAIPTRGLGL
jgi:hypothetical protein